MNKTNFSNIIFLPKTILIIGILASVLLILFSIPIIETTDFVCTGGSSGGMCNPMFITKVDLGFMDWFIRVDFIDWFFEFFRGYGIKIKFILIISIGLAMAACSVAYYFLTTTSENI